MSLAYAFLWSRQQSKAHDALEAQYQDKSNLIVKSQELRARRLELAGRMQQVQQLMDDKLLLSLLRNVSAEFGPSDCLEYVTFDARQRSKDDRTVSKSPYKIRIVGVTANSTTLAELMTRLGQQSASTMNVVLQSSERQKMLDGQVMKFEISCEQAAEKGT